MSGCDEGIWVDLFCGGGGASTGISIATGQPVSICVDLWGVGLEVHRLNHPETEHILSDVWQVSPRKVVAGRRVRGLWLSPPCTDFSNAKSVECQKVARTRALPWTAVYWARQVRPEIIIMENVVDMLRWGPLDNEGVPIPSKRGKSLRCLISKLERLGYTVEMKVLVAADYGAPTRRKRLFLIARCDGKPIRWPAATHGPGTDQPYRSAAEIIRWDAEGTSIFDRKPSLVPATLRRIATGLQRFVIDDPSPCVIESRSSEFIPSMIQGGYTDRKNQASRSKSIHDPLPTAVCSSVRSYVVTAHLDQAFGTSLGADAKRPVPTLTCDGGGKVSVVTAQLTDEDVAPKPAAAARIESFVRKHRRLYKGQSEEHPCVPQVMVRGKRRWITDIRMRILSVEEIFDAQGFPSSYRLHKSASEPTTNTDLVRIAGNSVCPPLAAAIVRSMLCSTVEG